LAVQVEDHTLEFGGFKGAIPEGQPGAGRVSIWDAGSLEIREWGEERIAFVLTGRRLSGYYRLVRFHRKGVREWLLTKLPRRLEAAPRDSVGRSGDE
jgi:bifunctional non-homologous end joining protein LigD